LTEIAESDAPVFIRGETGTGKELIARTVHARSRRAKSAFVVQNCAAMTDSLLQSLLFGHMRGAFTGANREQVGIFEAADGGTLFLDEIGDMSDGVQAAVLRAIDQGEITRLGETRPRYVDARVLSATNRDLRQEIMHGRFREDLYYRLCTFEIVLPPLRRRHGDVSLLAHHFLEDCNRRLDKRVSGFAPSTLAVLEAYCWPGNVRQLASEVMRACVLTPAGETIRPEALSESVRIDADRAPQLDAPLDREAGQGLPEILEATERRLLDEAMQKTGGNRTKAAALLRISRQRLSYRLQRLGLPRYGSAAATPDEERS